MMQDAWKSFPQQITQKINGLLEEAEPNSAKAFQLYKMCQSEDLWKDSFRQFSNHLSDFFQLAKVERSKSQFDRYLERPMDCVAFDNFQLTFRTASISSQSVRDIAGWAHHMLRLHFRTDSSVFSLDAMHLTVYTLTHPTFEDKDQDIEFEDFCQAWEKSAGKLYGKRFDHEQKSLLTELRGYEKEQQQVMTRPYSVALPVPARRLHERIYLTQTEIDWTTALQKAASENQALPQYPLTKGPRKERLIELLKCAALYEIAFGSEIPQLMTHRPRIRLTILDQCHWLLTHHRH